MRHFLLRFRKDILIKTIAAALVTGFCAACLAAAASDNWAVSRQTLYAVYLTGGRGRWHPMFSLLPIITSCLPLLGYLGDDMATQAAYLFPRSNGKAHWLWSQCGMLFLYVFCAALTYLTSVATTLTIFGQSNQPEPQSFAFYSQLLLLTCLFWFVFVLFVNLCALRLPITVALLIGIGVTAALAWVSPKSTMIFAVPMTHYYLDVHASSAWLPGLVLENAPYVSWFSWWISVVYDIVELLFLGFWGLLIMRKTEFSVSQKARRKE